MRLVVMRSPSNSAASSATQAGMVNSSANTVANGSSVTASAQQILPDEMDGVAREMQAHAARRELAAQRRLRRDQRQQDQQAEARADRQDFEGVERARPSARIASALTENDSSAPVIQKTTRPSCGVATMIACCECNGRAL